MRLCPTFTPRRSHGIAFIPITLEPWLWRAHFFLGLGSIGLWQRAGRDLVSLKRCEEIVHLEALDEEAAVDEEAIDPILALNVRSMRGVQDRLGREAFKTAEAATSCQNSHDHLEHEAIQGAGD